MLDVRVSDKNISMEVNTGAEVTVVSKNILNTQLQKTDKILRSATGQLMELEGETKSHCLGKWTKKVSNYIHNKREGKCPSSFGRDQIKHFLESTGSESC